MDNIIPLLKFDIDENDPNSGIKFVSFVGNPAMESKMIFFNEEKPKVKYVKLSGYEQVITGAMVIPDKPILRYDMNDEPYYAYFTADTVKKLRNKFHKEQQTANVNLEHNSNNQIDSYLIESYIIEDENQLASVKSKGIEDATIGTWMASYKINSPEVFQQIVDGKVSGISIEAFLDVFSKVNNNNNNKFNKTMNKLIEKFQALLDEMKSEKFEVANIYGGTDQIEWSEIGESVSLILPDGTKKSAEAGSYITDDEKELVVDEAGNLVEVKSVEKEIEEDAELAKKKKMEEEEEVVVVEPTEVPVVEVDVEAVMAENESLKAMVASLQAELDALKEGSEMMKTNFEKEIQKLKKAPLANPVVNPNPEKKVFSKEELAKLSVAERIAIKNGIELPKVFSKK